MSTAISNFLLTTGNYMRRGGGAYPLRGHNNVQGAGDMGAAPNYYPGYQPVNDPAVRAKFEKSWGVTLPPERGMDNHQMVDAAYEGKLRAMYIAGEDMISADSNANHVAGAFERLDFMVLQDIFFSETCRYADVVLPAAPALEKDGTFTSTERRIQRLYQALPELAAYRDLVLAVINVTRRHDLVSRVPERRHRDVELVAILRLHVLADHSRTAGSEVRVGGGGHVRSCQLRW